MDYLAIYLWLMPVAFLWNYVNSIDVEFRIDDADLCGYGFWHWTRYYARAVKLCYHDYFCVHAFWSRGRRERFRVADVRKMAAGRTGLTHQTLGEITEEFCADPKNHIRIEKEAYISAWKHWADGVMLLVLAPIHPATLIPLAIVGLLWWFASFFV